MVHLPLLDAEPFLTRASPARLDLIGDEQAPVLLDDVEDNLEILLRRRNKAAYPLNWLSDKRGDLARSSGLDHGFHVLRAFNTALRWLHAIWTPITIGIQFMNNAVIGKRQRLTQSAVTRS